MKIESYPIFTDYICPTCKTVTSKWCTKIQCDCYKKEEKIIIFGGITHFPYKIMDKSDD